MQYVVGGSRAWLIWATSVCVYVVAVFHRGSLGVAGLLAAERFSVTATQLASLTVVQFAVYAVMQIPVGVLLDRFGARWMLTAGLAVMTIAQFLFAVAESFELAVASRLLLGAGDALIFVSLLRLVAAWFRVGQTSFLAYLSAQVGQLGAVASATPLSIALGAFGWTATFAGAAAFGALLLALVACMVRDSPQGRGNETSQGLAQLVGSLRVVWRNPGTRLAAWMHFLTQFPVVVLAMLWGFPFLVKGEGLSQQAAGSLLMLVTGTWVVSGVFVARLVARFPYYRSPIVLSVASGAAVLWTVVLCWPGAAPYWLLVALVCVVAVGGPASMVGFDLARTFTPDGALGRANGIVNMAGFAGSLIAMLLIGVVLDTVEPRGPAYYDLGAFRWAMAAQYPLWILGAWQVLRYRRRAIAHLHREHPRALEALRRGETVVHPYPV